MTVNGHDPLREAAAQREAAQMLHAVLTQALDRPARVTRVTGPHLVSVARDGDGNQVLLVAMLNGDRWDIPMDVAAARRVAFEFASSGKPGPVHAVDDEDIAA